jgi:hypothetical protein
VTVIGLGAQDDLERARRFVDETGTGGLLMLWDPSAATWRHFGVTRQPAMVLTDPAGNPLRTWPGAFDEAAVLEALAAG